MWWLFVEQHSEQLNNLNLIIAAVVVHLGRSHIDDLLFYWFEIQLLIDKSA